jgi:GAF domain-containing protein
LASLVGHDGGVTIVLRRMRGRILARSRRRVGVRWAARAGILALVLNAFVPIHLAFDLGEALAPAHHDERHGLEWRAIAALIGHAANDADDDDDHGHHHEATCPVIAAFGALTGLVTATVPTLAQPIAVAVVHSAVASEAAVVLVRAAAYRSRAPPLA